jgi:hypothetical protein
VPWQLHLMKLASELRPMRKFLMVVIVAAIAMLTFRGTARSEERVALLIGNKGYNSNVGILRNPHNDVDVLETSLNSIGFKVTSIKDADFATMHRSVKAFIKQLQDAGPGAVSLFYYSGHGAADQRTKINYLIPVDVKSADDEQLWQSSFELKADLIDKLRDQASNASHFVIFDACRNELQLVSKKQNKSLGGESKGLLPVGRTNGVLIAYATAETRTASDEGEIAGPYARTLAEEITKSGVEAVTMFRRVQIQVKNAIGQDPYLEIPPLPEIYFAGEAPGQTTTAETTGPAAAVLDKAAFERDRAAMRQTMRTLLKQVQSAGIDPGGSFNKLKAWPLGSTINICFLDGDRRLQRAVANVARQWTLYANLDFDFGSWSDPRVCEVSKNKVFVRVSFNSSGNWAYIGTDQIALGQQNEPTLNLESIKNERPEDIDRGNFNVEILHEFGHVIGFEHTFQLQDGPCSSELDWAYIYKYFVDTYHWTRETVDLNLRPTSAISGKFDKLSVMNWALPPEFFKGGKQSPCYAEKIEQLSLRDKLAAYQFYPG